MLKFNKDEELEIAKNKFYEFCQFEGCDHISGEYALYILLKLCKSYNITSILEIGLGIGCIADTLLFYYNKKNKPIIYIGTENNKFCLKALKTNSNFYEKIEIFDTVNSIRNTPKFDLVIIDGGNTDLSILESVVKKNTILFVEGCRENQFIKIMQLFPKSIAVDVISREKNRAYSPFIKSHWMGGGRIIFVNPSMRSYVHYLKEKLNTKIKYSYRRHKGV